MRLWIKAGWGQRGREMNRWEKWKDFCIPHKLGPIYIVKG